MASSTITVFRGNTFGPHTLTLTMENGEDYVLPVGAKLFFTVKREEDMSTTDEEALISKEVTELSLFLSHTDTLIDTGSYVYDLKLVYADNTKVVNSLSGQFVVNKPQGTRNV